MVDILEADLRKLYGYPEDMTYEQYAESKRKEAEAKAISVFAFLQKRDTYRTGRRGRRPLQMRTCGGKQGFS